MIRRCCLLLASLVLVSQSALAAAPGGIEVTCDLDRTLFRKAARTQPTPTSVTFRLWGDATPGAPDAQHGSDYTVPLSALNVFKRYTDTYDGIKSRKSDRVIATIGSDGSPVLLPVGGIAFLDVTVGSTTLGCDHSATGSTSQRRRLQSVAFARESTHSETCDTCQSIAPPLVPPVACAGSVVKVVEK